MLLAYGVTWLLLFTLSLHRQHKSSCWLQESQIKPWQCSVVCFVFNGWVIKPAGARKRLKAFFKRRFTIQDKRIPRCPCLTIDLALFWKCSFILTMNKTNFMWGVWNPWSHPCPQVKLIIPFKRCWGCNKASLLARCWKCFSAGGCKLTEGSLNVGNVYTFPSPVVTFWCNLDNSFLLCFCLW